MLYNGFTNFSRKTNLVALFSYTLYFTNSIRKKEWCKSTEVTNIFINDVKGMKNDLGVFRLRFLIRWYVDFLFWLCIVIFVLWDCSFWNGVLLLKILCIFQNVHMELEDIDERIQYLDNIKNSSVYVKKRKNVKMMLEQFLHKIPGSPTLLSITPHDIRRFLVWKDRFGKTTVHSYKCKQLGITGDSTC